MKDVCYQLLFNYLWKKITPMKLFSYFLLFLISIINKNSIETFKQSFQISGVFKSDIWDSPDTQLSTTIKLNDMKLKFKKGNNLSHYHKIKLENISLSPADRFGIRNLKSIKVLISTFSKKEIEIASYEIPDNNTAQYYLDIQYNDYLDEYLSDPSLEYRIVYVVRSYFSSTKKYNLESEFTAEVL